MTTFKARVFPELQEKAQTVVDIYNNAYGSSMPGCNPAGLAEVLKFVADVLEPLPNETECRLWEYIYQLEGTWE